MKLNDVINWDEDGVHEVGKGWIPLVKKMAVEIKDCLKDCSEEYRLGVIDEFRFTQIKEKFGTLRVYFYPYLEVLDDIIDKYEEESGKTCEICGKPGTLKSDGYWLMTRCEKHGPKD